MKKIISTDDLQNANRKGYALGLSLAEIMLIILFVILLFLIRKNTQVDELSEVINRCGALCESDNLEQIAQSPLVQSFIGLPNLDPDWTKLTSERQNFVALIPEEESDSPPSEQKGDTSICTYDGPVDIGKSYPVATVYLQNEKLTLINIDINDLPNYFDKYGELYDAADAKKLFEIYSLGQEFTYPEFEMLNASLDQIGDQYETDTRANCRFAYNYYYDDSLSLDRFDYFSTRYWRNRRISEDNFNSLLQNSNFKSELTANEAMGLTSSPSPSITDLPLDTIEETKNPLPVESEETSQESESISVEPEWVERKLPVYPKRALARNIEGYATLSFLVFINGKPGAVRVIEASNNMFAQAADKALRDSTFKPATENGKPVISQRMETTYNFSLD